MKIWNLVWLLVTIIASPVVAEKHAGFLVDYSLSPHASATTLIGVNRALIAAKDLVLEKKPVTVGPGWQITLRAAELMLMWLPINYFSMLIQHEFFGHVTSHYEFGERPFFLFKDKIFNLPPPYGAGVIGTGAIRSPEESDAKAHVTTTRGVVAGDVMSERMALDWAGANFLEGRLGFLYLLNAQQTLGYTYARYLIDFGGGNDILGYRERLNLFLKRDNLNVPNALSDVHLNVAVALNALDPLSWWSFYSIYAYAHSGADVSFPWIKFSDNISYLPIPRAVLTPFGPEFYLNNYFKLFGRTLRVYGHFGKLAQNIYGGGGLEGDVWRYGGLLLGSRIEIFSQPSLNLNAKLSFADEGKGDFTGADALFGQQIVGALGIFKLSYQFLGPYALNLEIGYKSRGFVPGERLDSSFILRAGASLVF